MCEFTKLLQKPFPAEDIEWRVGSTSADKSKGIALAYITNRAIMARLDETFGAFGWKNEYKEWKGTSQLCGISVKHEGEWITKWDGADDSATEAVKGGLSDAMKRAGYQWGIGRYLYNLENMWVPIKPQGRSFVLVSEPRLPSWALPEGYEQRVKTPTNEPVITHEFDGLTPPPENEDMAAIEQASNERYPSAVKPNAPIPTDGANPKSTVRPLGFHDIDKLRGQLGWKWQEINDFATQLLQKTIKYPMKDYITSQDEWKKLHSELNNQIQQSA